MTLHIAGAGMAGLCAAARAAELGVVDVVVHEKGDRPGGSMLLSSCVVWRYRDLDEFRNECAGGDPDLQREVIDRLDDGIAWLRSLGAKVVWEETGNPRTVGVRFDPESLTEVLVRAGGGVRLRATAPDDAEELVLASGGFQGDRELVREHIAPGGELLVRANRWSAGDGLRLALARGATLSSGMSEFYGRAMPAPPAAVPEERFVELAQLYGRHALVLDDAGNEFAPDPVSWSETDLVQAIAARPNASAWYLVDEEALSVEIRGRTVREMVEAARNAGGEVLLPNELGVELPGAYRYAVHVVAGITHTIGGLRIDPQARVLGVDGAPIEGLYAAGADAGGISTCGYASGLASALVFGRIAAETVAAL